MSYTPTNWQTGDIITAPKLNNMETGIVNASSGGDVIAVLAFTYNDTTHEVTASMTPDEVRAARGAGKIVLATSSTTGYSSGQMFCGYLKNIPYTDRLVAVFPSGYQTGTGQSYVEFDDGWYRTSAWTFDVSAAASVDANAIPEGKTLGIAFGDGVMSWLTFNDQLDFQGGLGPLFSAVNNALAQTDEVTFGIELSGSMLETAAGAAHYALRSMYSGRSIILDNVTGYGEHYQLSAAISSEYSEKCSWTGSVLVTGGFTPGGSDVIDMTLCMNVEYAEGSPHETATGGQVAIHAKRHSVTLLPSS